MEKKILLTAHTAASRVAIHLFREGFDGAGMGLGFFVVIDPYEQKASDIVLQRFEIPLLSDLVDCALCGAVSLQLYYHGRDAFPERDEYNVGEALPCGHLLDYRIAVQCVYVRKVNSALERVFVVVAAVARDMDV